MRQSTGLPFPDRRTAGVELATRLGAYADRDDVIVLALPRGGVPVAFEVARALHAPLDVFVVRKLGVPKHEELAMGAIASGGTRVLNEDVLSRLRLGQGAIEDASRTQQRLLEERERSYRGDRERVEVAGRTVILVDDGMATGASMRVALSALRPRGPASLVVAVPVAAREAGDEMAVLADGVVCGWTPAPFIAISVWFEDFSETSDDEVRELLRTSWGPRGAQW